MTELLFLLGWLLMGFIGIYLTWRFDTSVGTITGWNIIVMLFLAPFAFLLGLCIIISSFEIPTYNYKKKLQERNKPE